ncbi:PKD domain-containing protein [Robertkochia solimangrovi]|uniref:PKD domain-containing protein n=1 Tax=Robertkochia solimangrovi TaxID=2213046 RepID=UPI0013A561E0|nr:PKD domain-containing protein [Robertkochia solimangrovi]
MVPDISYCQSYPFGRSGLQNMNINNPTSIDFGPNGKLYVSQQNGVIYEYEIERDEADAGNGTYTVINSTAISEIKNNIFNHNDDGTVNTLKARQITGILTAGTAETPILYVTSSDSRIGGGTAGTDNNLDMNSGILSRLTWNGSSWDKVDLVRGLPRCEENHSTNGMATFEKNGRHYLLIQQGGNTNQGAASNNFAGSIEFFLSAALLVVDLDQIDEIASNNGGPFLDPRYGNTPFVYDLPTLNDPEREDIDNTSPEFPYGINHPLYNATIDLGDPFGGNNGLNMAFSEPGGPVQIFAPGFRNAYDVVINENGQIFSFDNGPNKDWGGPPRIYDSAGNFKGDFSSATYEPAAGDYVTSEYNYTNGNQYFDHLHHIGNISDEFQTYYGGHTDPIRAFPSKAGLYKYEFDGTNWVETASYDFIDRLVGVSGYFNDSFSISDFPDDPRQGDYYKNNASHPNTHVLESNEKSTNGMAVYTASNFNGAIKGNLLAASYDGSIHRFQTAADGNSLENKDNKFLTGFGSIPLDVTAQGDNEIFPGTIWAVTYADDNITVFEPGDFINCLSQDDPEFDPTADYDGDGYTNEDEILSGTNYCSGGSAPMDNDGDFISDLMDDDDDNDGIPDFSDPFPIDANNGLNVEMPINYPFWNNDPGTGFLGLGFTGLMLNTVTDTEYLDLYDLSFMSFGGAAGKATVDEVTTGTARGSTNDQDYGFQFGMNADSNSLPFTIQGEIEVPFNNIEAKTGQYYGIYIGTGDQDNYFSIEISTGTTYGDGKNGISIYREENQIGTESLFDVEGLTEANAIELYIQVKPSSNKVQAYYSIDSGANLYPVGDEMDLPAGVLDPNDEFGVAVGMISSTTASAGTFSATWDYINAFKNISNKLSTESDIIDFEEVYGTDVVSELTKIINQGGPGDDAITITGITFNGIDSDLFNLDLEFPFSLLPGASKSFPISLTPNKDYGQKELQVIIEHTGENSPLIIPLKAEIMQNIAEIPVFRINAGSTVDIATVDNGPDWVATPVNGTYIGADYSVNTGYNFSTSFLYANHDESIPDYITEDLYTTLYATERYDVATGEEMEFKIPLENGTYKINLYLGTAYDGTMNEGDRSFNILLENNVVESNFDPVAAFGFGVGAIKSYDVTLTDGELNLSFEHIIENPQINAIEVISTISYDDILAIPMASVYTSNAPATISFDGSESEGNNPITGYSWHFGDGSNSSAMNPDHIYTTPGIYTVSLTVTDGTHSDTQSITINIKDPSSTEGFAWRINSGGPEIDYNGDTFSADEYYNGGSSFSNTSVATHDLYKTERTSSAKVFSYNVPLENGTYDVILHFAEIWFNATGGMEGDVGSRKFDVIIEDELELDDFDILAETGSETPITKSFKVHITDNELNLYFSSETTLGGANQPKVSAIEVLGTAEEYEYGPITVNDIEDQTNAEGDTPALSIAASGGNELANLTYSISGQPAGLEVEPTNGQIYGTIEVGAATGGPSGNGIYEVTVMASKPGSESGSVTFTWTITDAETDLWYNKITPTNYTARHECSFVQAGDKFYLLGGRENATTVDIYDYTTNTWSSLSENVPLELNHFQATEYKGLIWVIGAFKDNTYPVETPAEYIYIFDPAGQQWIQGPEIPENRRRGSTGMVVYNDKFYVIGGNTKGHDGGYVQWFDEFDPATGTWTELEDAPHARDHFQATVIDGKLYAVAGRLSGGDGGVFAPTVPEVDVYDFTTGTWSSLSATQNLPTPRAGASIVEFENKLFVIGGETDDQNLAYDITEIYDPSTLTWETGSSLNHRRQGTQAIVSGNGIFITSGSPNKGGGNQRNMEYYAEDAPEGEASVASIMDVAESLDIVVGTNAGLPVTISGGNIALWIESMEISGTNADQFEISEGMLSQSLLGPDTVHDLTITHLGTQTDDSATLTITYQNGESKVILLNSVSAPTAPEVVSIILINADTDTAITTLTDGLVLNSEDLSGLSLNIEVATDPETTGSVVMKLSGALSNEVTDNTNPYTVFGDDSGVSFPEGSYTLIATPYAESDASGLEGESITINFTVETVEIPVLMAEISTDITEGTAPLGIAFSAETSTGNITEYLWDFGDGSSATTETANHTYTEAGTYTVTLTVKDETEAIATDTVTIKVTESQTEPVISVITADHTEGNVPFIINLSAAQSTGPVTGYYWDLGDGSTSAEATLSHTYEEVGQYTITLTVFADNGDQHSSTLELMVFNQEDFYFAQVYPNPTSDYLNIRIYPGEENLKTVHIHNLNSQLIRTYDLQTLDSGQFKIVNGEDFVYKINLDGLHKGVYILSFVTINDKVYTEKIIVK